MQMAASEVVLYWTTPSETQIFAVGLSLLWRVGDGIYIGVLYWGLTLFTNTKVPA
jgi:hypothetical protein